MSESLTLGGLRRIDVISLFPEWFESLRELGLIGRALGEDIELQTWNPRDYTSDRHRTVDDRPFGGGPGMVMLAEPLARAIEEARDGDESARVTALTPQGRRLDQAGVAAMAARERLILVCGRYEGMDERVIEALVDEELSIGDYVLNGGEAAAAVVIDAVIRLQPGVLGHACSAVEDSFSDGLLDCPHYSRPETWRERTVPGVLRSGDHGAVDRWRRKQALGRTWQRRPELLTARDLSPEDQRLLAEFRAERDEDS